MRGLPEEKLLPALFPSIESPKRQILKEPIDQSVDIRLEDFQSPGFAIPSGYRRKIRWQEEY